MSPLTFRRVLSAGAAVAATVALTAAPADAATSPALSGGCPPQPQSQAFLAWGDPAQYVLANDGDFSVPGGWSVTGGAAVVAGSDGFSLAGAAPSTASLSLPAGSSATSPVNCVSLADPTIRFVVRNLGASGSTLAVTANVTGVSGAALTLPLGTITASSSWNPSPILVLPANALAPLGGGNVSVSFTFAPQGGDAWQVADLHIDPWSLGG